MKNKIELNEEVICKEYLETQIGVESMALKYHVGKKRIRDILEKHNICLKKRGGQNLKVNNIVSDWRNSKFREVDGKHYIAVDKRNGFTTRDYENKAGVLTTYINKEYKVEIPTLYFRRRYYMETGNYWWEQWFNIMLVDDKKTKKCPYCDWETIDIDNKSGWFEQHITKIHNISPQQHLKSFPEDNNFFKTLDKQNKRNEHLKKDGCSVICPLCNKSFNKLTEAHMSRIHNISLFEFRHKFPNVEIMSKEAIKQAKESISLGNLTVSKKRFVSVYERELQDFLKKNNIDFTPNRQILIGKEIDILIEKYKLGIEFEGLKFHTEFFGKKKHDYHLDKTKRCNEKGYSLIHIFEDEYVKHKDIVYEKLKHFLHIKEGKKQISARKCQIKEIYKHEAEEFLNMFHIQGFISSSIYLGAFYEEKLIGVMSFKNGNIKNYGWELTRFASDYNYIIRGVGGKLFSYFVKHYTPQTVYSFADRRWTLDINNNIYTKLGFVIDKINRPDYKYYNEKIDRYERVHKMRLNKTSLSKKYGFPLTMTETEMAKELGYDRIWDCGLIKYVYINPSYQE